MTQLQSEAELGTSPAVGSPTGGRSLSKKLIGIAEAYALVALTVLMVVFFSILPASSASFFTPANFEIVLGTQSVLLIIALAVLVPMVAKVWDFSPGAVAGMSAVFAASVGQSTGSFALAALAGIASGMLVGLINGLIVTIAKVNSVIATLAMTLVIGAVVTLVTDGESIMSGIPAGFGSLADGVILGIPKLFWIAIIVSVAAYYLLRWTPYGRSVEAIGSNRAAAKLVGMRVETLTASTFVVSGAIAGVAGLVILASTGTGNPNVGAGYTVPAFAAAFLGAAAIRPGRWNVGGLVVAILFLGVLNAGLTLAGAPPSVNAIANGVALIIGVAFSNLFSLGRGVALETN
jgi:ribose transport system permease protein